MSSLGAGAPIAACICYVTAGSREEARAIGRTLVAERLAACANLLDGMTSLYWWQGTLEQAEETVVILKTRSALVPALTERVKQLHSYECPARWRCPSAPATTTTCAGSRARLAPPDPAGWPRTAAAAITFG